MVERLQGIGLSTNMNGSDNVAILSMFDAADIPLDSRSKLVHDNLGANGDQCHGATHSVAKSSLNLKHYSAYYDMLRHGYRFGLGESRE